jgi:FtsH-binding integral membrane protein
MNKKKILFFILLAVILIPSFCFADGTTIKGIIGTVQTQLSGMGTALAAIAFIVAGIMFLTATGNPGRMTIAKGALIAAVIGIVIIILANNACTFVQTFFGVGSCS